MGCALAVELDVGLGSLTAGRFGLISSFEAVDVLDDTDDGEEGGVFVLVGARDISGTGSWRSLCGNVEACQYSPTRTSTRRPISCWRRHRDEGGEKLSEVLDMLCWCRLFYSDKHVSPDALRPKQGIGVCAFGGR